MALNLSNNRAKRKFTLATMTLAVFALVAQPLVALNIPAAFATGSETLYVDPSGDNRRTCKDPSTPCKTVSKAVENADSGDIISVGAGSYTENVTIDKSITVKGDPGASISGQVKIENGAQDVELSGLNLSHSTAVVKVPKDVSLNSLKLHALSVTSDKAIYIADGTGSTVGTLSITNSTINSNYAVYVDHAVANTVITGNTFNIVNGNRGVVFAKQASSATVDISANTFNMSTGADADTMNFMKYTPTNASLLSSIKDSNDFTENGTPTDTMINSANEAIVAGSLPDTRKPVGVATYSGGNMVGDVMYVKSIDDLSFTETVTDDKGAVRATFLVQKLNKSTNAYEGFCGNWNANSNGSHALSGSTHEVYTEDNIKVCEPNSAKWTNGTYKIFHAAYDEAGNEGKYNTNRQVFVIDGTNPGLSVKDGFVGNEVDKIFSNVSFKLSDNVLVDYVMINDHKKELINNAWSDADFGAIKQYLNQGSNTVTVFDVAGNSTEYTFTYDSVKPTVVEFLQKFDKVDSNGLNREIVTLTFSEPIDASSLGQGWNGSGNKFTKVYYSSKDYTVTFSDFAGNENNYTFNVDATNPTGHVEYMGGNVVNGVRYLKSVNDLKISGEFSDNKELAYTSFPVWKVNSNFTGRSHFCGNWTSGSTKMALSGVSDSFALQSVADCASSWGDGYYQLHHRVYDSVGNNSSFNEQPMNFVLDSAKPEVTGSSEPTYNPTSFTVTATDNIGVKSVTGNVYKYDPSHDKAGSDGYYLFKSNSSTSQNPFTVNLSNLGEGEYYVRYNASDNAGWTAVTKQFKFTVDRAEPTLTDVKFGDLGTVYKKTGTGVMFHFSASEELREFPVVKLGGREVEVEYDTSYGKGDYVAYLNVQPNIPNGQLSIEITYKDLAGNEGVVVTSTTNDSKVIVDQINPAFNITSNAVLTTPSVEVVVTEVNIDVVELDGKVVALSEGNKLSVTGEGSHTVVVKDKAGNSSTVTFTIDSTPPALNGVQVSGTGTQRTISGTTEHGAKVFLLVNGTIYELVASENGSWSQLIDVSTFTYGVAYPYSVYAEDAYGNKSGTQTGDIVVPNPGARQGLDVTDDENTLNFQTSRATVATTPEQLTTSAVDTESDIRGAQDTAKVGTDTAVLAASDQGWKLFGTAWYWWLLVVAALAGAWWFIAGLRRRRQAEETL